MPPNTTVRNPARGPFAPAQPMPTPMLHARARLSRALGGRPLPSDVVVPQRATRPDDTPLRDRFALLARNNELLERQNELLASIGDSLVRLTATPDEPQEPDEPDEPTAPDQDPAEHETVEPPQPEPEAPSIPPDQTTPDSPVEVDDPAQTPPD